MSCVGDEMCNLGAEVFPDGPSHVMNQIHQVFLNMKKKKNILTTNSTQRGKLWKYKQTRWCSRDCICAQTLHQALMNHHFEKLHFIMVKFGN